MIRPDHFWLMTTVCLVTLGILYFLPFVALCVRYAQTFLF